MRALRTPDIRHLLLQGQVASRLSGRTYDIVLDLEDGRQHHIYDVPVEYQIEDLLALALPGIPIRNV